MEHYFDLEEINAEMSYDRTCFINEFRRFLAERGVELSVNAFNQLQAKLPEQKSGNQIIQHAQAFSVGEFPITEFTI